MPTVKLSKKGSFQLIRLPRAFSLPGKEVAIRRDGDKIILVPLACVRWPHNFFSSIRITDPAFSVPC
jgi:virulence-associated protein VagC